MKKTTTKTSKSAKKVATPKQTKTTTSKKAPKQVKAGAKATVKDGSVVVSHEDEMPAEVVVSDSKVAKKNKVLN